jgi:hypothetical protein
MQPATVPTFGTLKVSRTVALPSRTSLIVGSRRPVIAFWISSVTL